MSEVCPYCGAPSYDNPQLEDDWGRLMCADCFVEGSGPAEPSYFMEGILVNWDIDPPPPQTL